MNGSVGTMLFVPGSAEEKLEKIPRIDADAFILDLEDAVALSAKPRARVLTAAAIERHGRAAKLFARVNSFESELLYEDLRAVILPGLAGVVLPKASSAEQIRALAGLLAALERERELAGPPLEILPMIESAAALEKAVEIGRASERVRRLGFGGADFALDLGLELLSTDGRPNETIRSAKSKLVLSSRVAGLEPPRDGSLLDFKNLEALREEAEEARGLGFAGKNAIHPAQLPVIAAAFRPSEKELERARAIVAAFARSEARGVGGIEVEGQFVDYPVVERARRRLLAAGEEIQAGGREPLPLAGLRVLDLSSLYAAPLIATNLGDFGAEVIKVEHPRGDDARRWGLDKDGVPLWWKTISRNKQVIALNLNEAEDREVVAGLAAQADVLIENFRPGRMESWGLGPAELMAANGRLVYVRVTGFGQTGPRSSQPGFGTLAEAFSGFAHLTGQADGPPTLPPFGLADGVAGLTGTYATMIALYWRDARGGAGQVIDISLYEPLFGILGPQIPEYQHRGVVQGRIGNRSPRTAPRNAYETADRRWVAISGGTQQIVNRIFAAIERPELAEDPRFADAASRTANGDAVDAIVAGWIGERPLEEVLAAFEAAQAPIAPVYDTEQIYNDPQYRARGSVVEIEDEDLGEVSMAGIVPKLSLTPGRIRRTGPTAVGADTDAVLAQLGAAPARRPEAKAE